METLGISNTAILILFLLSLVLAAFFCCAETAFIGTQRLRLQHLIHTGHPRAKAVARIVERPEKLLATVLLGINFFETAAATLGTLMAISLFGGNLGAVVATIVVTILTLIFAELVPKSLAARYSERVALFCATPIEILSTILYPFVFVLNYIGVRFTRLGGEDGEIKPMISQQEFRTAIKVGEAEGVVEEKAAEMLHNVFDFGNRLVREIMVPRTDIIWVGEGTKPSEFLALYAEHPYSRFPLYRETVDNIIGVLAVKDVLMAQAKGKMDDNFDVTSLARPAFFVPESKHLGSLLSEMQSSGNQMAIVVDEFGGTAGIITMEQLVQEILGDFGDELTRGERDFETIDERTFSVDGGMRIDEANEKLQIELPEGDYETVAGLVFSSLGHIPREGEQVRLKGLKLVVAEMKGVRIEKVVITKG